MYPKAVPDPVEKSATETLDSQIAKLSGLVDQAISGDYAGDADGLAKLVTAMARLIDARTKAEASVKPADLMAFMAGMSDAVNAHVAAPEERFELQRRWRLLAKELTG